MTTITFLGSSLSGTDGATSRTYTLGQSPNSNSIIIFVNGLLVHPTYDYTLSGAVITFVNSMWNDSVITIIYDAIPGGTGSMYTSATLVEAQLRATSVYSSSTTPTLDQVNTWIQEESRAIELMSGEVFSSTTESSVYLDYDGSGILRLPHPNILSITTFKYNINPETQAVSLVDFEEGHGRNYLLYGDEGEVEFINGANSTNKYVPSEGKKRFIVAYTRGYSDVPLEIQRLATLMVAKRVVLSQISSQANTEGGAISVGTIRIEDPSLFSLSYIKSLTAEIDSLREQIKKKFTVHRYTRVY